MKKTTVNILGVGVAAINYQTALKQIFTWITKKEKNYVCVAAAHLLMECQKNKLLLKGVNQAGLVTPDGMPLVWLLKLCGQQQVERVYGPDLMLKVCKEAAREKYTIFLLGGSKDQSRKIKLILEKKFPDLKITGYSDTPIRPIPTLENQKIIRRINDSQADIVFVGMGCPIQEQWMIDATPALRKAVSIGVGAAFDFITGKVKQAPVWMQRFGLEWFFRLLQEPRRLAKRYLLLNTLFIFLISKQLITNLWQSKNATRRKKIRIIFPVVLAGLIVFSWLLSYQFLTANWQFYSSKSIGPNNTFEPYDNLVFSGGLTIFNSQNNSTYAVTQNTGVLAWEFTAQNYSPFPATVINERVYLANFDGHMYSLDKKTGDELWRFNIPDQINPDTPVIASADGQIVFFGTRQGTLYALDSATGQKIWEKQFTAPDASKVFLPGTLHFGNLYTDESYLYVISAQARAVYALNQHDGQLRWQINNFVFNTDKPILTNEYAVFKQAERFAVVNKASGVQTSLIKKSADSASWKVFQPDSTANTLILIDGQVLSKIELSTAQTIWSIDHISWPVEIINETDRSLLLMDNNTLLVQKFDNLTNQNTIQAIDYINGQEKWTQILNINIIVDAASYGQQAIIGDKTGQLIALELSSGQTLWQRQLSGEVKHLQLYGDNLLVVCQDASDKNNFYYVSLGNQGQLSWKYTPDYVVNQNNIYFTDRAVIVLDEKKQLLEKIEVTKGNPEQHSAKKLNFSVKEKSDLHDPYIEYQTREPIFWRLKKIFLHLRYFMTHLAEQNRFNLQQTVNADQLKFEIIHDQQLHNNPFTALNITAVFINKETNEQSTIKGYYYDKNTWQLEFKPEESAEYTWQLTVKSPYAVKTWSGSELLTASDKPSLTVKNHDLVMDEGLFLPLGIQQTFIDRNYNGSFTDDLDDSSSLKPITNIDDYRYLTLNQYLDHFKKESGINIFRYGVDNWAPPLYQSLNPAAIVWDINGGHFGDKLLAELKTRDIRAMMTIFGFYPPFDSKEEIGRSYNRRAITHYLDYVIARYSADIDLWEINNEARSDQEWYRFVIDYLKRHDPYHHPISTNWEEPDLEKMDYLSIHWYNQNTSSNEALADAMSFINASYDNFQKPTLISELGFKNYSWFPDSDVAVRVLTWLATFQKVGIIFWNQGQNGIYQNANNANVYLGPTEQKYLLNLTQFLPILNTPVEKDLITLPESQIQVRVLKNNDYYLAYLLKLAPAVTQPAKLPLTLERPAAISWYDPKTGNELTNSQVAAGNNSLAIPDFATDLALKITYDNETDK